MPTHNTFVHRAIVRAACALLLGTVAVTAPVAAATSAAAIPTIAHYLDTHPGGIPISDNEVTYHDGAVVITVDPPPNHTLGVPDCPRGWFCFYDRSSFGYPRGKLSSCGSQNLATWNWQYRVESAHYNLDLGSVTFLNGGSSLFQIGVANRTIIDTAPYRNWANSVYRHC